MRAMNWACDCLRFAILHFVQHEQLPYDVALSVVFPINSVEEILSAFSFFMCGSARHRAPQ